MERMGSVLIEWNFGKEHLAEIHIKPLLAAQKHQADGSPGTFDIRCTNTLADGSTLT
jgi:hypothetical protein